MTTTQWATAGDFNYDVGFAVMNAKGGEPDRRHRQLAPAGALRPRPAMKAYGYPAARPFNGQ